MRPSFWIDDLDVFFGDFGVDAVYTPQGGPASTIKVIFDNSYVAILGGGGLEGVESTSPGAVCKSSDIVNARYGETLQIDSITYKIAGIEPDGTGMTVLRLSRD